MSITVDAQFTGSLINGLVNLLSAGSVLYVFVAIFNKMMGE